MCRSWHQRVLLHLTFVAGALATFLMLQVVGRLAPQIARLLMGKHKPTYTPHVDAGDYVVVVNAKNVEFTGDKYKEKLYKWHTGWMGGLKTKTARQIMEKTPERVLESAVKGMMPPNQLRPHRLRRLRIFAEGEHKHKYQVAQSTQYAPVHMRKHYPVDVRPKQSADAGGFLRDAKLSPEELAKLEFKPLEHDEEFQKKYDAWRQKKLDRLHKYQALLDKHLAARAADMDKRDLARKQAALQSLADAAAGQKSELR